MSIIKEHFYSLTPEQVYLEYFNDWLTIDRMADFYNINPSHLICIIEQGEKDNNRDFIKRFTEEA